MPVIALHLIHHSSQSTNYLLTLTRSTVFAFQDKKKHVNGIETERESQTILNLITATDKGKVYKKKIYIYNYVFVFGQNELTCTIIFQRN